MTAHGIPTGPYPLPDGWCWVALKDLAEIRNGVTKGRDLSRFETIDVPYLRVANVQNGYLNLDEVKRIQIKRSELEKYQLRRNDILFTEGGDRDKLGRGTVWNGEIEPCVHQNHIHCARLLSSNVEPMWISLASQLPYARDYFWGVASQSVNLASLNASNLKNLPIPLPPLDEQRNILKLLESVNQQLRTARAALARIPALLKAFRQAVLAAAFRGELTERDPAGEPASRLLERIRSERRARWSAALRARGKDPEKYVYEEPAPVDEGNLPSLPEGWVWTTIEHIAEHRLGKMLDKEKNKGEIRPYLRNINVRWFSFDLSDVQYMRVQDDEVDDVSIRKGDLVICEGGEPGRCAVWEKDDPFIIQKALHRVRPFDGILAEYLMYRLAADAYSDSLEEYFTGTTIKHFTGQALRSYVIPLPPVQEQRRIVEKLRQMNAQAEAAEAAFAAATRRLDAVEQAVLGKAFRGEL